MALTLFPPIQGYFSADADEDSDAFLSHFARNAVVVDERRTYTGHEQILQWKLGAAAQYDYTTQPFESVEQHGHTIVTAHLTGDFPGSPVDLRYRFTLRGNVIAALEIAP